MGLVCVRTCTHRTIPTVPTVPYLPYLPNRTHRKGHMYLPLLNHQKTCFSFLLKLDKIRIENVETEPAQGWQRKFQTGNALLRQCQKRSACKCGGNTFTPWQFSQKIFFKTSSCNRIFGLLTPSKPDTPGTSFPWRRFLSTPFPLTPFLGSSCSGMSFS